jgi:hypothetical protein
VASLIALVIGIAAGIAVYLVTAANLRPNLVLRLKWAISQVQTSTQRAGNIACSTSS